MPPTRSFRSDGRLTVARSQDLPGRCVDAVGAALKEEGSIGVIAADAATDLLAAALQLDGIETMQIDTMRTDTLPEGDGRVAVVPATLAKGLEYDHVVVMEPAEIVEAEEWGLNRLYVVLTRAVSRLDVLHHRDLPPLLEG